MPPTGTHRVAPTPQRAPAQSGPDFEAPCGGSAGVGGLARPRGRVGGSDGWRKGALGGLWPFVPVDHIRRSLVPGALSQEKLSSSAGLGRPRAALSSQTPQCTAVGHRFGSLGVLPTLPTWPRAPAQGSGPPAEACETPGRCPATAEPRGGGRPCPPTRPTARGSCFHSPRNPSPVAQPVPMDTRWGAGPEGGPFRGGLAPATYGNVGCGRQGVNPSPAPGVRSLFSNEAAHPEARSAPELGSLSELKRGSGAPGTCRQLAVLG